MWGFDLNDPPYDLPAYDDLPSDQLAVLVGYLVSLVERHEDRAPSGLRPHAR